MTKCKFKLHNIWKINCDCNSF